MPDEMQDTEQTPRKVAFLRVPLFRLLAINLAAGMAVAALLVGGLLALNPFGLRDLIFADNSPGTALNTVCGSTRESEQAITIASGFCPQWASAS